MCFRKHLSSKSVAPRWRSVRRFVAAVTLLGAAIANDSTQWRITAITNQRFL
jgi:hypothetical protein